MTPPLTAPPSRRCPACGLWTGRPACACLDTGAPAANDRDVRVELAPLGCLGAAVVLGGWALLGLVRLAVWAVRWWLGPGP